MGYSTNYELEHDDSLLFCPTCGTANAIDHEQLIVEQVGYSPFETECKWYDNILDMVEYSKKHPDILFTLHGKGEENDDIWKAYFKNGKYRKEKAGVQIAEFDESKLA